MDMARDVIGLMDALEIKKANIVGASMGGAIAQLVTIHYPERVSTLTTISASSGDPDLPAPDPKAVKAMSTPAPATQNIDTLATYLANVYLALGSRDDAANRYRKALEQVRRSWYPEGGARQVAAILIGDNCDRRNDLAKINVPVMVIHGDSDPLVNTMAAKEIANTIPNSELHLIKGMGHDFSLAFIDTITNLIAENAAKDVFYFTTSDNVKLYVHTAGTGKPCLFIHGGPGLTSYIFEATPAAKLIEQKAHMIYFDQRGSGRSSSAADSNYSIKRMEQDIEELRAYLKIDKWSVMAHSFGGMLMTPYARDYPESVSSLIYVHCGLDAESTLKSHIYYGRKLLAEIGDSIQPDKQLPLFNQMMNVHAELAKKGIEYKIMFRSQRQKNIEDSLINRSTTHFNQDFQHQVWTMKDYQIDYAKYTPDINCPVMVITGIKDYAVGPDAYKRWHFKNRTLLIYNGAHTSYQEEPRWFAKNVLAFLDRQ